MKEKNKLRFIGASAYPVSILKNLCEISDQIDVVLSYSRYTLFDSTLENYLPFFKVWFDSHFYFIVIVYLIKSWF